MSRVRFEPPQRTEKKKKSIGENAGDARQARISFKTYLRELEEENEYEEDDDLYEEEAQLPEEEDGIEDLYQKFLEENEDLVDSARAQAAAKDATDAVNFLLDEMEIWLQNKGHSVSDVRDWIEGPAGDELFDKFYNGLT
jgi:hypothetical protein